MIRNPRKNLKVASNIIKSLLLKNVLQENKVHHHHLLVDHLPVNLNRSQDQDQGRNQKIKEDKRLKNQDQNLKSKVLDNKLQERTKGKNLEARSKAKNKRKEKLRKNHHVLALKKRLRRMRLIKTRIKKIKSKKLVKILILISCTKDMRIFPKKLLMICLQVYFLFIFV